MQDSREKFVGKVRVNETKYGQITSISFSRQDLEKMNAKLNDKGWMSVNLKTSKAGNQYLEIYQPLGAQANVPANQKVEDDLF